MSDWTRDPRLGFSTRRADAGSLELGRDDGNGTIQVVRLAEALERTPGQFAEFREFMAELALRGNETAGEIVSEMDQLTADATDGGADGE